MSVEKNVEALKEAIATFEEEHGKYVEKGVNSAGSKARKALMGAKKVINSLRKDILSDQKEKKAAKKETKVKKEKPAKEKPAKEEKSE